MTAGDAITASEAEPSPHGKTALVERARGPVLSALEDRPYEFDFFQAVRLLTRGDHWPGADESRPAQPVGHDYAPQNEAVRFRTLPSHSFPQAEIASFTKQGSGPDDRGAPAEMTITFLGLTGPAGVLPHHYTQTVIDRLRLKDRTLLDFLDLFNHRIVSLFYRAWEKHRVPPLVERARSEQRDDGFTHVLNSVLGLGATELRGRLEAPDELFLYYSGLFAHFPRNPLSLERMLAEWLGLPVSVQQFRGQWLSLESSEQTAMPNARRPVGLNCQLGLTAIAGERVWSVEGKFRLRLGPLSYEAFQQLLPGSRLLTQLGQIVRTYSGPELDFDAQLVLRRREAPFCRLAPGGIGARLGWNTWACSRTREDEADEPVFVADGWPSR